MEQGHDPRDRDEDAESGPTEVPVIGQTDEEPGRSRGSIKRERVNNENALAELVIDLLALNETKWRQLGVPEFTIDRLLDGVKIKSHTARARHMRLVRSTLRDTEWSLIRRGLDRLRAGLQITGQDQTAPAITWTEQLLVQGDPGLVRFTDEYPKADRKRLRQLIRNVTSAPPLKRGKARIQLERAVAHEISGAVDNEPG